MLTPEQREKLVMMIENHMTDKRQSGTQRRRDTQVTKQSAIVAVPVSGRRDPKFPPSFFVDNRQRSYIRCFSRYACFFIAIQFRVDETGRKR